MTQEELLQVIEQAAKDGVTQLDLSNEQLDSLPAEIGQLINLRSLNLRNNQVSSLPAEIGQLVSLRSLDFSINQLSSLPAEIGQLVSLQSLDFSINQLSSLPAEIGQLVSLQSLYLSDNQLSSLPAEIGQLVSLQSLDLNDNQLSSLPAEIGQLVSLQSLDLRSNQLSSLPAEIGQLVSLQSLDLRSNQLSSLPAGIGQLVSLQSLDLRSNKLSSLPAGIGGLTSLQSLYLNDNQLSNLPAEIRGLTSLQSLYLINNQLSSLPAEIGGLTSLQSLYLNDNQLSNLPAEIGGLTSLQSLDLRSNQLSSLPAEIGGLTSLQSLDLHSNQLSSLPAEIDGLTSLQSLDLRSNQLSSLPAEIGGLTSLQSLYLINNQLSSLPTEIGGLTSLQSLYLINNQLSSLPAEICRLQALETFNIGNNYLTSLPIEIKQLSQLKKLDLRGNPIPIPPEILGSSWTDLGQPSIILNFYFRVQAPDNSEPLYEAKLLIVGEGEVGKTSLAKKIQDEFYELQSDEKSTHGIDIIRWYFEQPNGQKFRVNIWDFGGQEIYHQTHQFFLTERSLYALVADTRKENTDFYYWLNVVELLSNNSPVFIIKNEKQNRQCEINDRQLRGEFSNLKEILATNLADNRGLQEIKDAIQLYISRLPHVGTRLPKLWVRVRSVLENYARNNYISLDEYYRLCRLNGLTNQQDMLLLSRYLHDLGVCLHFQTDPLLKKTIILKPEWGTAAVYKVLDNETVRSNLGCFTQDELADIWSDAEYADMRDELLHLMMRFKLCYEIPGRPHTYIAPNLLSVNQPDYDWDATDNLCLRYEYEFMPKGILTRLIVEMHPWIEQQLVWKTGVVLHKDQTCAEVIEHYNQREIRIRVTGSRKKDLLAVVTHELTKIHQSYERLQYDTLVPCNCEEECKNSQTPYSYPLETLHKFLNKKRYLIQCYISGQDVDIRRLISDVFSQELELEQKYLLRPARLPTPTESLQRELEQAREKSLNRQLRQTSMTEAATRDLVFISYSHKDKKWFDDLKAHLEPLVREQNLKIWEDTQIQPGAIWRDEIEKALSAAKVAVLLVSPTFLSSKFINQNELPVLLDAAKTEGVQILWVPLQASNYKATAIEKYQAVHPTDRPLKQITAAKRDTAWVEVCTNITAAMNR
jgi:internalin A